MTITDKGISIFLTWNIFKLSHLINPMMNAAVDSASKTLMASLMLVCLIMLMYDLKKIKHIPLTTIKSKEINNVVVIPNSEKSKLKRTM